MKLSPEKLLALLTIVKETDKAEWPWEQAPGSVLLSRQALLKKFNDSQPMLADNKDSMNPNRFTFVLNVIESFVRKVRKYKTETFCC